MENADISFASILNYSKINSKAREQAVVSFRTFVNNLNLELLDAKKFTPEKNHLRQISKKT